MFVYVSQKVLVFREILMDSLTFQRTMEPYLDLELYLLISASATYISEVMNCASSAWLHTYI